MSAFPKKNFQRVNVFFNRLTSYFQHPFRVEGVNGEVEEIAGGYAMLRVVGKYT